MKAIASSLVSTALLGTTLVFGIYHLGAVRKPEVVDVPAAARWLDKRDAGLHHLIVEGTPYGRGLKEGEFTKHLLFRQEEALIASLSNWLPERWMLQLVVLAASLWYHDVDRHIAPAHLEEMLGISRSASPEFDFLADGFTRQVAYHGLHEVGHILVDQGVEDMGCTVVAAPIGSRWIIGRNFDFEGGRIFDSEKILKWVFPERGFPFVSVSWAGMVGAVTGVNAKGLYASLNAGGSDDFARVGTPSTLVLLKVLQEAQTASEALAIIRESKMFITDIFVVSDREGRTLRIEKSPARTGAVTLREPSVVTNHLIAPEFENDETNRRRRAELTTEARLERGEYLVRKIQKGMTPEQTLAEILNILRDKGADRTGAPLALGNRRAIDALIATHSVIYDGTREILYVSQGPAVAGAFLGFDLKESFAYKEPRSVAGLARDARVSDADFAKLKETNALIRRAHRKIERGECAEGKSLLDAADPGAREQSPYYFALGDAYRCFFEPERARQSWENALRLMPAYARETRELERRLKK